MVCRACQSAPICHMSHQGGPYGLSCVSVSPDMSHESSRRSLWSVLRVGDETAPICHMSHQGGPYGLSCVSVSPDVSHESSRRSLWFVVRVSQPRYVT